MRRREFIALLGGATAASAAWPLAAGAQTPPKIPRVGFIAGASATGSFVGAFRKGLRELGYMEGQTIALEVRYAEGRLERIPELVAELVRLKMDVLVAPTSQAALAAKKATRTIPIVMVGADPVGLGVVASLARPGGNVTGLSIFNEEIIGKRLQFLKELIEAGKVSPVIDRAYPLSEARDAMRHLEEGHARGKVVISVRGAGPLPEGMIAGVVSANGSLIESTLTTVTH